VLLRAIIIVGVILLVLFVVEVILSTQ